jgi:catechol 2,3-dioxygenase-like lactoylglutathione lyase family enzyme
MQLAPTLAGNVFQIGYVVPDIQASVGFFKDKLGVPNFLVKEDIQGQDQTYRGKPGDFRHSIAFGYAGEVQIELIQSLSGASTYSEFLEQNPKGGVHHLGILAEDYNAGVAGMSGRGFKMVQSGRNGRNTLRVFRCRPSHRHAYGNRLPGACHPGGVCEAQTRPGLSGARPHCYVVEFWPS